MEIKVVRRIMEANEQHAEVVRRRLREAGVVALNLISAPGSGKTSLIETAIRELKGTVRLGVIEGDPDTTRDAERIARLDVPVVQINTEGGCHLEATMVLRALEEMTPDGLQLLFIENVGNLVCPVVFDLGETYRVAVVSAAEGHDKPAKYPALFRTAHVTVLTKIDLIPYLDFDEGQFTTDVRRLNPQMPILRVSCRTGEGVSEWVRWLQERLQTGYPSPQTPRDR
ncbi:MAG: hydrogenase nickel incorporation protein HypB [Armatimonadota bacterium]|nr:hydrogenase nickel incorporation protein HypB [Armatimonadota bacterium]MDW8104610.1 hydrogenase nickel incorporation protein HypB [Armatimonadota bacterium]MDW8291002.1 hydrogenase nickel incorporation protein HypB [Armatimonadota bacterium]